VRTETSQLTLRNEYRPSPWLVQSINLTVTLDAHETVVICRQFVVSNPSFEPDEPLEATDRPALILNGAHELALRKVLVNKHTLADHEFTLSHNTLKIPAHLYKPAEGFTLETHSIINPSSNKALIGLYQSGGNYFTQCEAEGFRQITWSLDRPDVMSIYTVELRADARNAPVLLSNGNLIEQGPLDQSYWEGHGHYAIWHDPFPKPSYLFAIVAGKLDFIEQTIVKSLATRQTESTLQIWTKPGQQERGRFALECLKSAIEWDREKYGLELDLDRFMIVAVDDFNGGAMENKGLNLFNSAYVFANKKIATDHDHTKIQSIIGHEYFHNWTGNRVTCRDWFQLTLKEGLTVFRDQQFSADMMAKGLERPEQARSARAVHRIQTVVTLRRTQFIEDAGPMAHPIRPDSYEDIDNFYTPTIYEKGAEVVRMLHTLLGGENFKKGMELYFSRHDGQAVTCDDFLQAMSDVSGRDLSQFSRWYSQARTPVIQCSWRFNRNPKNESQLVMKFEQKLSEGQAAFHMPIQIGIVHAEGHDSRPDANQNITFELNQIQQELIIQIPNTVSTETIVLPSINRGFSAPIILDCGYRIEELKIIARCDRDEFNRWQAMQELHRLAIQAAYNADQAAFDDIASAIATSVGFAVHEYRSLNQLSAAYLAEILTVGSEQEHAGLFVPLDPIKLRNARFNLLNTVSQLLYSDLVAIYDSLPLQAYHFDARQAGFRSLRAVCLRLLVHARADENALRVTSLYHQADNLTDRLAALAASMFTRPDLRDDLLNRFAQENAIEPLLLDKFYALQATKIPLSGDRPTLEVVKSLWYSKDFDRQNPNRIRALLGQFFTQNLAQCQGAGEPAAQFFCDAICEIDQFNPTIAARVARSNDRWSAYEAVYREPLENALRKILNYPHLSISTREVVSNLLYPNPSIKN
jgi:aminopeptidase N